MLSVFFAASRDKPWENAARRREAVDPRALGPLAQRHGIRRDLERPYVACEHVLGHLVLVSQPAGRVRTRPAAR